MLHSDQRRKLPLVACASMMPLQLVLGDRQMVAALHALLLTFAALQTGSS
jgi:hypothetical protein